MCVSTRHSNHRALFEVTAVAFAFRSISPFHVFPYFHGSFYLFFISPLILFICIGACSADNVVITSFCNVIERKRTLAAVGAVELLIDGRIRR